MWKPHPGQCPDCPPGTESLITTKSGGRCARHLYEFKQAGKPAKPKPTVQNLKDKGLVRTAKERNIDYADEADRLFSIWIRKRRANEWGRTVCITCGLKKHWGQMTCGHYHKRRHLGTRFEEKACEAQCYDCQREIERNTMLEKTFAAALIKLHGPGILEELEMKKNMTVKISQPEYKELCEQLTLKIANL